MNKVYSLLFVVLVVVFASGCTSTGGSDNNNIPSSSNGQSIGTSGSGDDVKVIKIGFTELRKDFKTGHYTYRKTLHNKYILKSIEPNFLSSDNVKFSYEKKITEYLTIVDLDISPEQYKKLEQMWKDNGEKEVYITLTLQKAKG